jgi:hypothetical protein
VAPQIGIFGLIIAFALGSAAIAAWVELRFPTISPKSPGYAFLHIIGAAVGCHVATSAMPMLAGGGTLRGMMAALFFVALPVLLYVWLSLLWFMKLITTELKSRYG